MRYNVLTAALIATTALCMTGCVSSRTATSERLQLTAYSLQDTVHEQVVVTVFDTITITKTITIRESESGDTLRVSTVTERDHVRDRSQLRVKSEKLKVETDTVYVERDSLRLTAYSLINENENDNENKKVNRVAQSLKWLFLTLVAIIAIIILIRIKLRR